MSIYELRTYTLYVGKVNEHLLSIMSWDLFG